MLFEPGFLGTKALVYMDIVTLYFALLPFLLGFSIFQAIRGNYRLHYQSQFVILAITLIMVLIFETGVRITGGFAQYAPYSKWSYDFLVIFLSIHILVALLSIGGWLHLLISTYRGYRDGVLENATKHKKMGKWIFASMTLTSIMGCSIYVFLFC